jgi:GMP synthase-like glutamine amidotransferase
MKKPVLIVKNISHEGPGILTELLEEEKIPFHLIDLHRGEIFPHVSDYAAVVILGGPDSANDSTFKMKNELDQIKEILSLKIPYLGICLGLQTLVKAGGGFIKKNKIPEIGWIDPEGNPFQVKWTDFGKSDPISHNLSDTLPVFHLHGETVELTKDMKLLATGAFCENQIVRVGEFAYGIQSHFELTEGMVLSWLEKDPDLQKLNQEEMVQYFQKIKSEYQRVGRQIFRNFLQIAGLVYS